MAVYRTENREPEKTLVSWKEIASFLDRAERTVKRWERERGLPVHRVPGGERGGVFAYPEELRAWLLDDQGQVAQSSDEEVEGGSSVEVIPASAATGPVWERADELPGRSDSHETPSVASGVRSWTAWIAPPVLIVFLAGVVLVAVELHRNMIGARNRDSQSAAHVPVPHAEELYLQGRYEWSLRTAESLRKSIDAYTQAIVQDPAYAQAYAGLAESYDLLPEYEGFDRNEAFSRAKAAAERAIALDPNLAAGHRAKAFALIYGDWNAPESDVEFKKALALAPNEVETHHWYATSLYSRRRKTEALAQIDEALRLSPTNPAIQADGAFLHISLGDNVEANIKTLRELARTQPTLVKASRYLYGIDFGRKDYENFLTDLRQTASIAHGADESELSAAVERGWAHGREHGLLIAMRDVYLAQYARGKHVAFDLAGVAMRLGQPRAAVHYFKLALGQHDIRISWLAGGPNPELEKDPDYPVLITEINESLHVNPSPSLHLAVTTQPGKFAVGSSGRQ